MLDSQPWRRPLPHSTASTTRSRVCTGLTLTQPEPRRPASYGAIARLLTTTPSWPAASASRAKSSATLRVVGDDARDAALLGDEGVERGRAARAPGTSSRSRAVEVEHVEEVRRDARRPRVIGGRARRGLLEGTRAPVSSSAIASPSSTTSLAGSARTTSTTSGSRSVMSSRLRVTTTTSSPWRWTWMRMPSSLVSTATGVPAAAGLRQRRGDVGRAWRRASAGAAVRPAGRPRRAPPRRRSGRRPTIGTVPPASIAARRTAVSLTPEAAATASWTSASSAPCRTLPVITPRNQRCSSAVSRANRPVTPDERSS